MCVARLRIADSCAGGRALRHALVGETSRGVTRLWASEVVLVAILVLLWRNAGLAVRDKVVDLLLPGVWRDVDMETSTVRTIISGVALRLWRAIELAPWRLDAPDTPLQTSLLPVMRDVDQIFGRALLLAGSVSPPGSSLPVCNGLDFRLQPQYFCGTDPNLDS